MDNGSLQARIVQRLLTAQAVAAIIPALTELQIKCWLMVKGRDAELIEYIQTHNIRFAEEANLIITRISYNSPLEINFAPLDPKHIAEALVTGIEGVSQVKLQYRKVELEIQAREQEIQRAAQQAAHENEMALLEEEEKRLELVDKRVGIAIKMITELHLDADQAMKNMFAQTLLPDLLQLESGKEA